jgi:hypothetical protein
VALQQVQMISILRQALVIGEGSSRLGILSEGPPLFSFDMLLVIGGGLRT